MLDAVRDSRDACKLGALWGVVHTVRWPMATAVAARATVGLRGVTGLEKVLPTVIAQMLPVGLRGVAIVALLSAFLATFASTVNGGASYLVRHQYAESGWCFAVVAGLSVALHLTWYGNLRPAGELADVDAALSRSSPATDEGPQPG